MPQDFPVAPTRRSSTRVRPWPSKYSRLFVGRKGLWFLIKYEFINLFITPMPGALGLAIRKIFYPRLLKRSAGA